jgi:TatA/E family protein of Tat protein translocase
MTPVFAWVPGFWEILVIAAIGLVLFGRKLPEMGRYLGKGIVEFKNGLAGVETGLTDEVAPPRRVPTATGTHNGSAREDFLPSPGR